jgi:hypothetical protein
VLKRADAANGPMKLTTIFPSNSSQSYRAHFFRYLPITTRRLTFTLTVCTTT